MKNLTTTPSTSDLGKTWQIEELEIVFVDHFRRQAKNMILTVCPRTGFFVNPNVLFTYERNTTIMDGTKKNTIKADMNETVCVSTSIGNFLISCTTATKL